MSEARLAIHHPPGRLGLGANVFGKDVANFELYRALAQHGGFAQLDVLSQRPLTDAELAQDLLAGAACATRLRAGSVLDLSPAVAAGALLRGQPDLYELAWRRRQAAGDRAFSLMGLVHTIAPPAMRQIIAMSQTAPTHPWDAIICTSPAVRDNVAALFDAWGRHLAERTGGAAPPRPALPIVPLGVEAERFRTLADQPAARATLRAELGLAEDDVLVLWVGRLSYFEKAFPQPMFRALQLAAAGGGRKVAFVMAGWFPNPGDREHYAETALRHAPDVAVSFADGNDPDATGRLWAAADIFLSLVDNIQETFGITPLEAMAAGLPVVASDWDGYRFTLRHGVEAFLIPTLGGPAGGGRGAVMAARHGAEIDSYQAYVGAVAQHTAVHVGRAAEALGALIGDRDLRRRMGAAGRARVAEMFDWPVVAGQVRALSDELGQVRAAAAEPVATVRVQPSRGDPFADFAGFASQALTLDTPLRRAPGTRPDALERLEGSGLDQAFGQWRAPTAACVRVLELLADGAPRTARDILLTFPVGDRRAVEMSLAWMAKQGLLDWL